MDASPKENLLVDPNLAQEPEIGRWLWAMQDARQRTRRELSQVRPEMVDWRPQEAESSIGAILYHLADIEADWLYVEVLEQPFPPEVAALFDHPTRDQQGHLTQVGGFTLAQHLERLELVRQRLLEAYERMDLADFRRPRSLPQYDVTPEWVLHHLMQHEAEHRSQLAAMRDKTKHHLG